MRLILVFLLLSLLAAYSIETLNRPPAMAANGKLRWPSDVFVRSEGRNCPLFYPAQLEY